MIEVETKIKVYEKNDKDLGIDAEINIVVKSHWNNNRKVDLVVNGNTYTVVAADLNMAITNAINS